MSKIFKKNGTDAVVTAGLASRDYAAATLSIATATVDHDVADVDNLFDNIKTGFYVEIRTNQPISIKLNSTANASIDILSADSPYIIDWSQVENIFISNASGNLATVKIVIAG